ncbi:MAG: GNAT family N-acetyltransferase [Planctomycetaceae bacterium]
MLDVWREASSLAHPFLGEEFLRQEAANIPEFYLPVAETFVFEKERRVVGFISLLGSEIGAIFVHPDHHGEQVGWSLLRHARQLRGDLTVKVFQQNAIGRRFYDRCGFVLVSEETHDQTGRQLLCLKLERNH